MHYPSKKIGNFYKKNSVKSMSVYLVVFIKILYKLVYMYIYVS